MELECSSDSPKSWTPQSLREAYLSATFVTHVLQEETLLVDVTWHVDAL